MAEFERNKMTQLNAVFSDVSTGNKATQVILEIFKTQNVVNEIRIKKEEVQKNLDLSLSSSFQELNVALKQFDETYVSGVRRMGIFSTLVFGITTSS